MSTDRVEQMSGGFQVVATIEPDEIANSEGVEANDTEASAEDIAAFNAGDWQYVVVIVKAYREGVELGFDVLGGVQAGTGDGWTADPLRDEYPLSEMVPEALRQARETVGRLCASVSA